MRRGDHRHRPDSGEGVERRNQGRYPVRASSYDTLPSQYKNTIPPEQGYLLPAEIAQASPLGQDTGDLALLTDITKDTIAVERELHKTNPTWQINFNKDTPGGQNAWEDFVKYCDDAGVPWVIYQVLYENFTAGTGDPR